MNWESICSVEDIVLDSGVAALVDGRQIAIFRVSEGDAEKFYAVSNFDPFSRANVISRGIVGSIGDATVVASPIYKQHFNLETGVCIEDESVTLGSWPIKVEGGKVLIGEALGEGIANEGVAA